MERLVSTVADPNLNFVSVFETEIHNWSPLETNLMFGLCFLETDYAFRSPIETKIARSLTVEENQKQLLRATSILSQTPQFSPPSRSPLAAPWCPPSHSLHTHPPSSFLSLTHSLPSSFKLLRRVLLLRCPGNPPRYGSHLCPPPIRAALQVLNCLFRIEVPI